MLMITIADYNFLGPLNSMRHIEGEEGIFVILSEFIDKRYILDVDYASNIKKAIKAHARRKCWDLYRKGKIRYAVLYTESLPEERLENIVETIRVQYDMIPCG